MTTIRVESRHIANTTPARLADIIDMSQDADRLIVVAAGADVWALVADANDHRRRYFAGLVNEEQGPLANDDVVTFTKEALLALYALGYPIAEYVEAEGVIDWKPEESAIKAAMPWGWDMVQALTRRARLVTGGE
jgi:hypothetical protein